VGWGDGDELVARQGDKAEAAAAQVYDLLNDGIRRALAGALSIGTPNGTEGAVFGASSHGLHRRPHIAVGRQQIPAGLLKFARFHSSSVVDPFRCARHTITDHAVPNDITI